jgi:hypothetical protein
MHAPIFRVYLSFARRDFWLFEILFEALFILEKSCDDSVLRGDAWMMLWMLLDGDSCT